jgi:hypothetical protein
MCIFNEKVLDTDDLSDILKKEMIIIVHIPVSFEKQSVQLKRMSIPHKKRKGLTT